MISENESHLDHSAKPSVDSLLEDLFGLNVRGFKTLRDLFIKPKRVFESARITDWAGQHTPTFRLTFSLITLSMLLSFFWAAEDSAFYQGLLVLTTEIARANPDAPDPHEAAIAWLAAYSFCYPIVYMIVHGLVGSLVFLWGQGVSWVTRLRLYFALLTVGMFVAVASMLLIPFVPVEMFVVYTLVATLVLLVVHMITYLRGMSGPRSGIGLWLRAPFIALLIIVTDFAVAIISGTVSGQWMEHFAG